MLMNVGAFSSTCPNGRGCGAYMRAALANRRWVGVDPRLTAYDCMNAGWPSNDARISRGASPLAAAQWPPSSARAVGCIRWLACLCRASLADRTRHLVDIAAQHRVHAGLVAGPGRAEPSNHILI